MQTAGWWHAFVAWYRKRPFIGGVLTVLGGIELFFSGQLSLGDMKVQVGIEGFQATLIPIVLVLVGVLATLMPQHRIFYGVIALVVAVYSLVGVNLGGFFVGMILASVGGVMIVSWMPRRATIAHVGGQAELGDAQPDDGFDDGPRRETSHDADSSADDANPSGADAIAALVQASDDDQPDGPAASSVTAGIPGHSAASSPSAAAAATPSPSGRRRGSRSTGKGVGRRTAGGALAIALTVTVGVGLTTGQPQRAAAAEATGVCIFGFIGDCSTPSPSPTPSSTDTPAPSGTATDPSAGGTSGGGTGGGTSTPAAPSGPQLIAPASASPVFTGKPALLQGSSLSFSGLRYLGLATVRLSDGSTATVLKLSMDSVTIPGFRLDTRDANGEGTDTVATQMAFSGGVDTYCSSLKGILQNGAAVQYDITHPPSTDGSVPVTRIISLEVFGITGGSSALTGFHEIIS